MKFEADIIEFLQAGSNDFWLYFFKIVTLFGSWLGFALALLIVYFKKKSFSYAFFLTFGCGVGLNFILKNIIMRPRPFVTWEGIMNLGGVAGYSMPSGHSCSAMIIAVFISYLAIKYAKNRWTKVCVPIIMTLYFALIALSRIFLGAHYLTDVIAGGCEGLIVAIIGILLYNLVMKKRKINGKANKIESDNNK